MLAKINGLFRLTKDAELIYGKSGNAILKLSLACSEKYKDEETQLFIDGVAFSRSAEIISQYAGTKGTQIYLVGKAKTESWKDKQGNNRSKISMTIEGFEFVGKGKETQQNRPAQDQAQGLQEYQTENIPQDNQSEYHPNQGSFSMEDEIPFAPIGLQYKNLLHCC